jgi:uncharacterized membrane protein
MATYTGSTQAKPGVVKKISIVVVGFVLAAALVIALVAMQGGSPARSPSGTGQTQSQPKSGSTGGGSGQAKTGGGSSKAEMGGSPKARAIQHTTLVCGQCAP